MTTSWSLRTRATVIAASVLSVGLVIGATGLAVLFVNARLDAIDAGVLAQARDVQQLVASGELPAPLPAGAAGTGLVQVIDPAGTVLAASASASRVLPFVPVSQLPQATGSQPHFATTAGSLGNEPLRVAVLSADLHGTPVRIVAALPFGDEHQIFLALRRVLAAALPVLVIAAATGTWLAVGSALRPIDGLRAAADTVAIDPHAPAPRLDVPRGAKELTRLAETLNRMLDRIHASQQREQMFLEDAAHELRSPIASVRTQLDVALATPTRATEWPGIARDVLADVDRLADLANDLLLLARAESGGIETHERVNVAALLDQPGCAFVQGSELMLRRMFDNLTTNAAKHASTRVDVRVETTDGSVVVTVDDDGPGIPEAEHERVFERWARLDAGRSRDEGGYGLGLPIARAIARAHDGEIRLTGNDAGGLRVTVTLPAVRHDETPSHPPR